MSIGESEFAPLLKQVVSGTVLSEAQSARAFGAIMSGAIGDIGIAAFLTALSMRAPTVTEITGAARAMRAAMVPVAAPSGAIDLCGTGGDGHGTLNVSTAASFVAAGCGVPVAKHGNRNMSSRTGAADVLEALGVRIDVQADVAARCLEQARICFLFAQTYHPAMKYVAAVRKTLGFRTIFNLLGPLSNPAQVKRQLLGVFAETWIEPVAAVLSALGAESAWVVHGRDGLDELSTAATTAVAVLADGGLSRREIVCDEAGLKRGTLAEIKGGSAEENADAIRGLLAGRASAFREIVLLNVAAALVVAGKAKDLREGAALGAESIASGRALRALQGLVEISRTAS